MKQIKKAGNLFTFFLVMLLAVVSGLFVWIGSKLAVAKNEKETKGEDKKEERKGGWIIMELHEKEHNYKYTKDEIRKLTKEFISSFLIKHLRKDKKEMVIRKYEKKLEKGFAEFPGRGGKHGGPNYLSKQAQEIFLNAFIRNTSQRKDMINKQKAERISDVKERLLKYASYEVENYKDIGGRMGYKKTLLNGFLEMIDSFDGLTAEEKKDLERQYRDLIFSKEQIDIDAFCNGQPFPFSILE